MKLLHEETTRIVIKAFYNVYNKLGYGFLEKVYENALSNELRKLGLNCEQQYPISVYYGDHRVGKYFADLFVNECIIVEIKSAEQICKEHECQLINYLKATRIEIGILLNFGKKPQFRRKIFSNKNPR